MELELIGRTGRTVDVQAAVSNNLLDLTLLFEVSEGLAGQAAVDLQTVDEGSDGDEAVGLNILVELLGGGLVEDDGVLGLVLDYFNQSAFHSLWSLACRWYQGACVRLEILLFASFQSIVVPPSFVLFNLTS